MKRDLHLTDEALLELAGERLSQSDRAEVNQHLSLCVSCRERFAGLQLAHSVFERLAEEGLGETREETGRTAVVRPVVAFPTVWAVALGLACVSVLFFLLSPWAVSGVRASELLSQAVKNEDRTGGTAGYLIKVQGKTCASGRRGRKAVLTESSGNCTYLFQQMKATGWVSDNPLSARAYSDWRSSLHKHRDLVEKLEDIWRVKTTTEEGPIRAASLEMRASDYHATKLTLDFEDEEQVSISETEDVPNQPMTADNEAGNDSTTQTIHALNEDADLLEAKAWTELHRLDADTGWEAIVLRKDRQVQVKAFVETDERRQEIATAFAPYPAIALEIHSVNAKLSHKDVSPQRASLEGYAPGLAEAWLEMHFPDADARMEYSNNVLSLSQHILGRAFFLDRLRRRQAAMSTCSCSGEMAALVAVEQQTLSKLQANLSQSLEPLIGAPTRSPERTLSLSEARNLDTVLEELLSSSAGANGTAFDLRVQQVHRLL